jgi:hypothetical protein
MEHSKSEPASSSGLPNPPGPSTPAGPPNSPTNTASPIPIIRSPALPPTPEIIGNGSIAPDIYEFLVEQMAFSPPSIPEDTGAFLRPLAAKKFHQILERLDSKGRKPFDPLYSLSVEDQYVMRALPHLTLEEIWNYSFNSVLLDFGAAANESRHIQAANIGLRFDMLSGCRLKESGYLAPRNRLQSEYGHLETQNHYTDNPAFPGSNIITIHSPSDLRDHGHVYNYEDRRSSDSRHDQPIDFEDCTNGTDSIKPPTNRYNPNSENLIKKDFEPLNSIQPISAIRDVPYGGLARYGGIVAGTEAGAFSDNRRLHTDNSSDEYVSTDFRTIHEDSFSHDSGENIPANEFNDYRATPLHTEQHTVRRNFPQIVNDGSDFSPQRGDQPFAQNAFSKGQTFVRQVPKSVQERSYNRCPYSKSYERIPTDGFDRLNITAVGDRTPYQPSQQKDMGRPNHPPQQEYNRISPPEHEDSFIQTTTHSSGMSRGGPRGYFYKDEHTKDFGNPPQPTQFNDSLWGTHRVQHSYGPRSSEVSWSSNQSSRIDNSCLEENQYRMAKPPPCTATIINSEGLETPRSLPTGGISSTNCPTTSVNTYSQHRRNSVNQLTLGKFQMTHRSRWSDTNSEASTPFDIKRLANKVRI